MKYPVKYTFLGFLLNSIIDNGGFVELEIVQSKINDKKVLSFLKERFGDDLDLSLYTKNEIIDLEEYFYDMYSLVDSKRKFGIEKNGICLLVAYCLNALQNNNENIK
ncbi:hypothetical protein [Epilithonimonas sp.]|uniref:hypothetical protein n=1 Tax=Epilithonimonas sp. TaxID=2894511 RepID=UPI00289F4BDE|nr:hypothetical protein [Epilithonimonas sp.]